MSEGEVRSLAPYIRLDILFTVVATLLVSPSSSQTHPWDQNCEERFSVPFEKDSERLLLPPIPVTDESENLFDFPLSQMELAGCFPLLDDFYAGPGNSIKSLDMARIHNGDGLDLSWPIDDSNPKSILVISQGNALFGSALITDWEILRTHKDHLNEPLIEPWKVLHSGKEWDSVILSPDGQYVALTGVGGLYIKDLLHHGDWSEGTPANIPLRLDRTFPPKWILFAGKWQLAVLQSAEDPLTAYSVFDPSTGSVSRLKGKNLKRFASWKKARELLQGCTILDMANNDRLVLAECQDKPPYHSEPFPICCHTLLLMADVETGKWQVFDAPRRAHTTSAIFVEPGQDILIAMDRGRFSRYWSTITLYRFKKLAAKDE